MTYTVGDTIWFRKKPNPKLREGTINHVFVNQCSYEVTYYRDDGTMFWCIINEQEIVEPQLPPTSVVQQLRKELDAI